ncbi:hypothetical protein SAMN05216456_2247 [Devosia crocina]|uniref:Uncharacterized protein n=1 Tax=Devosia crocina TaxID=429728 RepID=A0A1I7NMG3_9HYPH|nr:hypothetical protein [Devosia crocina]SFV35826.1 hypothetical protein SAMN05216456_2247 [Devosia crocina]
MTQLANRIDSAAPASPKPAAAARASGPFCGLIDAVLVHEPVLEILPGAVSIDIANAIWTWVRRDLCPDIFAPEALANGVPAAADVEAAMPEILARMKAGMAQGQADAEGQRRLSAQLGKDAAREQLPTVLLALRNRALLAKAQAFGKATNSITDETALGTAMQAMPLQDPPVAALVFHAAVGQVAHPARLTMAAIKLAGAATEVSVRRVGLGPLIDAYIAHAQNQLRHFQVNGPFADVDLVCRSLERFNRLVRALTGYLEFQRGSHATAVLSTITKNVSDRLEPRLKEVVTDLNQAMRRRENTDRLDTDKLLTAVGGIYLLAAVRDCRDSLALNTVFEQAWNQSGQALEIHIQRNMELFKANPEDTNTMARLDAVIQMAQVRFSPEYAETLKRARQAVERRS